MKNLGFWIPVFLFLLLNCNQRESPPTPLEELPAIEVLNSLDVKLAPLSDTELKLSAFFSDKDFRKLRIEWQGQALDSTSFTKEIVSYEAILNFPFKENTFYDLVLETRPERDTVYQYRIEDYQHQFLSAFRYEALVDIQILTDFDISPSGKTIYFCDFVNNIFILKKLDITSGQVTILDENFENGNLIRAISDEEILYGATKLEGRSLQGDSMALIRLNPVTGEKVLIEDATYRWQSYSRIINGYMLVPNPRFSPNIYSLLHLDSGTKTILEGNMAYPLDAYFNQFYLGNQIFDFEQKMFFAPLSLLDNNSLMYYDEDGPYSLAFAFIHNQFQGPTSKIQIYKEGDLFYEDNFQDGRIITYPKQPDLSGDKVLLYQSFDPNQEIFYDGYYELDLSNKTLRLIQHDDDVFVKYDFQLDGQIISVRANGIYSLRRFE